MNNRDIAIEIYNRLNRWIPGDLSDFATGIIEDELDIRIPGNAVAECPKCGSCNLRGERSDGCSMCRACGFIWKESGGV